MITITPSPMPVERIKRIKEWLDKEECRWLQEALRSDIAAFQAEASNLLLSKPEAVLVENTLPDHAHTALRNAARAQIVLECLAGFQTLTQPLVLNSFAAGHPAMQIVQ